jgi:hypothetical protein
MILHPWRMMWMTLPFRAARADGVGISPGLRPLIGWTWRMVVMRLADADVARYWLVRGFRRR